MTYVVRAGSRVNELTIGGEVEICVATVPGTRAGDSFWHCLYARYHRQVASRT